MLTVRDLYHAMDEIAPFHITGDWDNVGLLVGSPSDPATKVMLALDATQAVIDEAIEQSVDLIITHHALIFEPLYRLRSDDLVYQLVENGIGLVAAHTNLDMAPGGVNDVLAQMMQLENRRNIGPSEKYPEEYFYGGIGELPEPVMAEAFAQTLKVLFDAPGIRYIPRDEPILTVAYCGGSGGGPFFDAISAGADAYVTGELDHHLLLEAKRAGIALFLGGHFHTETVVLPSLKKRLQEKLPQAKILLSARCTDAVKFI